MAYRLHSERFNSNFWYIAIPKTGSQSIRKLIDENIDDEHILYGAGSLWHMSVMDIIRHPNYNIKKDNFFATVRNPWAQAWSNFNYQKKMVEDKLLAYRAGEDGIQEYRKKYPMNIIYNLNDTKKWNNVIKAQKEYLNTFDDYVFKMREKIRYPLINTADDLDAFIRDGESVEEIDSRRRDLPEVSINGLVQTEILAFDRSKTNHLITIPIEKPKTIMHFFNEWFPECNIKEVPFINQGTHANKNYTNFYSKKTRDIIYEVEYTLIQRHNYKFGD